MIVLGGFILIYVLLVSSFVYGFQKMPKLKRKASESSINFSIIIPFRNEEKHLPALLDSISNLNYPKSSFECLFVDDESSDDSVKIIKNWMRQSAINSKILTKKRRSKSPKKDAIETAIEHSQYEWIITTDADCIVPSTWLNEFSSFAIKNGSTMIAGPVKINSEESNFLNEFQKLDFLSLQGSTIGGNGIGKPFLCNGANLAYQKKLFKEMNGFEGNSEIASGDDIFLFEKFLKKDPKKVHFIKSKNAIVSTSALESWSEIVHQRVRWASKSGSYRFFFPKVVGLIVFLGNLSLLISLFLIIQNPYQWYYSPSIWILKAFIDSILLNQSSKFLDDRNISIITLFKTSFFYPFFAVFIVLRSMASSYQWKGRNFSK